MIEWLEKIYTHLDATEDPQPKQLDYAYKKFFYYADKIITGIIYFYKFTYYAEFDDLFQEARLALMLAIEKKQFNVKKGSIFNFVSFVTSRNLMNYTKKSSRYNKRKIDVDFDVLYNDDALTYVQDFEQNLILEDILMLLLAYFSGKQKFEDLSRLLINYHQTHRSSKFIKKQFVQYAAAYNYSPSIINTFFEHIKRSRFNPEMRGFLELLQEETDAGKC